MVKHRFLRYMGGKTFAANWIVSKFPPHRCFVDVFGGGASIIFAKKPSLVEIYNDIWSDMVNLFLILRNKPKELQSYLKYTPISHELYNEYREKFSSGKYKDEVERAAITFFLLRCSMNGNISSGWHMCNCRNHAHSIKVATDNLIDFAERFRRIIIENLDFRECIKKYDSNKTLFYCDPPYLRLKHYKYSFKYRDHRDLAKVLNNIQGKAIISYYPDVAIPRFYQENKWFYFEKQFPKYSQVVKSGENREYGTELLITNYEPPKIPLHPSYKPLQEVLS